MSVFELDKMTSPAVRRAIDEGHDLIVVPFGAMEQHGGHLPIGTDAMLGDEIGRRLADHLDAFLAPTVRVGCSEHHLAFAGTMTLAKETLKRVASDCARGLARHGFRRIVLVPTHGGNFQPLVEAVEEFEPIDGVSVITVASDFNRDVLQEATVGVSAKFGISPGESGAHSGEWETSIMLHLAPELVHMEAAEPGYTGDMADAVRRILSEGSGVEAVTSNGVMGDPSRASGDRGEEYLQSLTQVAIRVVEEQWPQS
jgi:creatinine amidohydrolase